MIIEDIPISAVKPYDKESSEERQSGGRRSRIHQAIWI